MPTTPIAPGGAALLTPIIQDDWPDQYLTVWTAPYGRFVSASPGDSIAALDDEESTVVMLSRSRPSPINWVAEDIVGPSVHIRVGLWEAPRDLTLRDATDASFEQLTPAPGTRDPVLGAYVDTKPAEVFVTGAAAGGPPGLPQPLAVSLTRTFEPATDDQALWMLIRQSTDQLSFTNYSRYMDLVLCMDDRGGDIPNPPLGYPSTSRRQKPASRREENAEAFTITPRRGLPFPDLRPNR